MSEMHSFREKTEAFRSKFARYPRHVAALLRHGGPRRAANVALIEGARLACATRLAGMPYYFFVDPANVCNLRCPLCPTGTGELGRSRGLMRMAEYGAILERIAPYAIEVSLHNWGEPLLNPDIYDMIAATAERGIATNLSSNLSVEEPDIGERLVSSGLEYLIVSLDGTSQEVYSQYRVRGRIELVLRNLRAIVAAKERMRRHTPFIEWQFLVMRHNEAEMALAQRLASEIGVDRLRFRSPGLPFAKMHDRSLEEAWMPTNPAYWDLHPNKLRERGHLWDGPCHYLYRSMTVNPGGGVAPCCVVYDESADFGNLLQDDLATIWNNERYRASRALFSQRPAARAGTICDDCHLFSRSLHTDTQGQEGRA